MEKPKFKVPNAVVVVFIVLIITAIATWFIPTSAIVYNDDGTREIIYNAAIDADGAVVENAGTKPAGLWDVLVAPIKGFTDAAPVSMSVLISGGLLAILSVVGAMDAGVGAILKRFKGSKLIFVLTLFFAITGSIYGAWEELPAYAMIIIPMCVMAGYDVMTGFLIIFIGATIGNMASTTNPYSVGAAVAAIGSDSLALGTGLAMRLLTFAAMFAVGIALLLRYANRVKKDPSQSVVAGVEVNTLVTHDEDTPLPEMTKQRKWSLVVFAMVIIVMVLGYMPWGSINVGDQTMYDIMNYPAMFLQENVPFLGNLLGCSSYTWLGDWYFNEYGVVWLAAAIIIGLINKMPSDEWVDTFVKGAGELVSLPIVFSVARGVSLLMTPGDYGLSYTIVYAIRSVLTTVPMWAFAIAALAAYILIGFVSQSTSACAGMTMPILGAVAYALFEGSAIGAAAGQMVLISCFTLGLNFTASGFFPEGTKMGVLDMTKIPYGTYCKEAAKILIPATAVGLIVLIASPYLGLAG